MMDIPIELKNAIKDNKLIVFVGAGLSYTLKNKAGNELKGWGDMVVAILEHLDREGYGTKPLQALAGKYEPIEILNLIEKDKTLPKDKIYLFIRDFLKLDVENNNFSLHKKITQLANKIITTNYDTAFEIADDDLRTNRAYKGRNLELVTGARLIKLHGCYEDGGSMIFFPSNYDSLYDSSERNAEHLRYKLMSSIYDNTILFLGTGMGDYQINTIFKEIKKLQGDYKRQHFIVTNTNLDSQLDFLTPISIKDFTEIPVVIDSLLEQKEKFQSQKSSETIELERQLDEANKKIKHYEEKGNKSDSELIEQMAYERFEEGLEFHIAEDYQNAIAKYQKCTALKENFHTAYYNWGIALTALARVKEGQEKKHLLKAVCGRYEEAIKWKEDYHEAYNNLGIALNDLAEIKEGKEKEHLLKAACGRYEEAIKWKKDKHEAYNNWGVSLCDLAEIKEGKEKEHLLKAACGRYEEAIKWKEDYHEAYNNWGITLAALARIRDGKEKKQLYEIALEKFKQSKEHGGKVYNLGCLYTIKNEKDNALKYLEIALYNKEITTNFVLENEYWKEYLNNPAFQAIIAKYKEED